MSCSPAACCEIECGIAIVEELVRDVIRGAPPARRVEEPDAGFDNRTTNAAIEIVECSPDCSATRGLNPLAFESASVFSLRKCSVRIHAEKVDAEAIAACLRNHVDADARMCDSAVPATTW